MIHGKDVPRPTEAALPVSVDLPSRFTLTDGSEGFGWGSDDTRPCNTAPPAILSGTSVARALVLGVAMLASSTPPPAGAAGRGGEISVAVRILVEPLGVRRPPRAITTVSFTKLVGFEHVACFGRLFHGSASNERFVNTFLAPHLALNQPRVGAVFLSAAQFILYFIDNRGATWFLTRLSALGRGPLRGITWGADRPNLRASDAI